MTTPDRETDHDDGNDVTHEPLQRTAPADFPHDARCLPTTTLTHADLFRIRSPRRCRFETARYTARHMGPSNASRAALLPLVLLVTAACSGTDSSLPAEGTAEQAIQGGQSAGSKYPFVLGMVSQLGGGLGICSGTLIAPNLVMTARHCVSATSSENIDCKSTTFTSTNTAKEMAVTQDTVMDLRDRNGNFLAVSKVVVPDTKTMCGHDIALLILADNISADQATPARPQIYKKLTDGAGVKEITAIGYGTTDGQNGSGTRRIRENIPVLCAFGHPQKKLDCAAQGSQVDTLLTASDVAVGTGVCEGDSGSSAFDQEAFDKGEFVSVGILSRGAAGGCDVGVYTRVDALADIISDTVKEAAAAGGYDVPSWANPPVDPGATCGTDDDCTSGSCVDGGQGSNVCAVDCTDACDDGYSCQSGHCLAKPPTATATTAGSSGSGDNATDDGATSGGNAGGKKTTTITTGCNVAADPTKPIPWRNGSQAVALAFGVALLLRRRSR